MLASRLHPPSLRLERPQRLPCPLGLAGRRIPVDEPPQFDHRAALIIERTEQQVDDLLARIAFDLGLHSRNRSRKAIPFDRQSRIAELPRIEVPRTNERPRISRLGYRDRLPRRHGTLEVAAHLERVDFRVLVDVESGRCRERERLSRSEEHTSELQSRQYLVCR